MKYIDLINYNKILFLEDLENGNVILIGASTENPYYSLNPAISRVLIFEFKKTQYIDIKKILKNIVLNEKIDLDEKLLEYVTNVATGDHKDIQ